MSEGHADVSWLMACMLEYPDLKEVTVRFAEDDNLLCEMEDVRGTSELKV